MPGENPLKEWRQSLTGSFNVQLDARMAKLPKDSLQNAQSPYTPMIQPEMSDYTGAILSIVVGNFNKPLDILVKFRFANLCWNANGVPGRLPINNNLA